MYSVFSLTTARGDSMCVSVWATESNAEDEAPTWPGLFQSKTDNEYFCGFSYLNLSWLVLYAMVEKL